MKNLDKKVTVVTGLVSGLWYRQGYRARTGGRRLPVVDLRHHSAAADRCCVVNVMTVLHGLATNLPRSPQSLVVKQALAWDRQGN